MKFILIIIFSSILLSEDKYKEPEYVLISKDDNIEIREYGEYIIAKTVVPSKLNKEENNMFKTLASYIFGANNDSQKIPMTAPVTTFNNDDSYNMIFYMLDVDNTTDLPIPNNNDVRLDVFTLDKCAVIKFSWFTTDSRINKYTDKLKNFLKSNNLTPISPFMVNRYDPPWRLPFMRRNEILVKIK